MTEQAAVSPAQVYEQYFVPAIFTPWTEILLQHAAPQPGERVLDLACGTGVVARGVAPLVGVDGKVVALDLSPDMLDVARALPAPEGAAVAWREGNAMALDLPDNAFDLVLCQQGLQFFPDDARATQEMQRVLATGGRAVIAVWQGLDHHPVYKALSEAEARYLNVPIMEVAAPFFVPSAGELRTLFEGAGFQHTEIIPISRDVSFPSPERFVEITVLGGAAVVPDLAEEDPTALIQAVVEETQAVVQRYSNGDIITFPMPAHIAIAHL